MQPAPPPPHQPLAGIEVIDFSRYLPGPYCSMQLAQLGARVTTIERPPAGDPMRALPPHTAEGESLFATALHRRKARHLADLADPDALAEVLMMCAAADVVLETFRPGVADRLGIGAQTLRAATPSLVYCSISGYGQTGPWRHVPGHDANYLAASGLQDRIGPRERPVPAPVPLADVAAGSMAATAICAALVRRAASGEGATIDLSMTEAALNLMAHVFPAGELPEGERGRGVLGGDLACFDLYECADGRWLAVSAIEPHFFARMCELIGCEELVPIQLDPERQHEVRATLAERLRSEPAGHWHALLATEDTCVSAVLTMAEAAEHPQLVARGAVEPLLPGAQGQDALLQVPASPFVFDGRRS